MANTKIPVELSSTPGIVDNSNATAITIDSSENVGIGTSSPLALLDVAVLSSGARRLLVNYADSLITLQGANSSSTNETLRVTGDNLRFATGSGTGTERMRIDSSGNVGIGTSSPNASADLHIADTSDTRIWVEATSGDTAELYAGTGVSLFNRSNSFLNFGTNNTERMRIDSSGRVLLSHASAVGGHSELLGIDADQASGYGIFVSGDSSTGGSTNINAMRFYDSGSSAGIVGSIVFNDTLTAYNTSSDYRLKENVDYTWDATTRLKQLKPARFNFIKNKDKIVDGFIAHEVQDIVPEAVTGTKDAVDSEGNPEYQGIDQSKLVPLLVKTIQELEARITALES